MGCAKSSEAQQPQSKMDQNNKKSNQVLNPKQNAAPMIPFRNEQQKKNAETSLRESGRPGWNQPQIQQKTLAVPQQPVIIDNSPVNIIYQSDPVSLPDIKNIDRLESNQILPHPDKIMSEIKQISQENVVSNEIKRLQPVSQDPKQELRTINNTIKQHSEHLEERVKEDEIKVFEVQPIVQDKDAIGEQIALPHFSLLLPRIQILPHFVPQPA